MKNKKKREEIRNGSCYRNSRFQREAATINPFDLENAPNEMRIEILFLENGRESNIKPYFDF